MTQIAVIGAGIVGLTTALEIQARLGHAVTIYAESFPGDEKSIRFTSPWAGAHHVSLPGGELVLERETFKRLWDVSFSESEEARCFMRTPQIDYFDHDMAGKTELEHMPDFRPLNASELMPHAVCGVAYSTINIDTTTYLPLLFARFLACGGRVCRKSVQHIDQVLLGSWGMPVPDALVICAGIGARFLGGVEDRDIYPIRGQTVLIRAPWVRTGKAMRVKEGDSTYVIARPGGDVILGGTRNVDDWYPHPRVGSGREILERALALMPELVHPSLFHSPREATVADLESLVVEHGCGLRPARRGGIRLEGGVVRPHGVPVRVVPVVYNYGHGGAGYQTSWGSARVAAELLEEGLKKSMSL